MSDQQQNPAAPAVPWGWPVVLGASYGLVRLVAETYKWALGNDGVVAVTIGTMVSLLVVAGVVGGWYARKRRAADGPVGEEARPTGPPQSARHDGVGRG